MAVKEDQANFLYAVCDTDGKFLYGCQSLEMLINLESGTARGKDGFQFIHPEDRERSVVDLKEVTETGLTRDVSFRVSEHGCDWIKLSFRMVPRIVDGKVRNVEYYLTGKERRVTTLPVGHIESRYLDKICAATGRQEITGSQIYHLLQKAKNHAGTLMQNKWRSIQVCGFAVSYWLMDLSDDGIVNGSIHILLPLRNMLY